MIQLLPEFLDLNPSDRRVVADDIARDEPDEEDEEEEDDDGKEHDDDDQCDEGYSEGACPNKWMWRKGWDYEQVKKFGSHGGQPGTGDGVK